MEVNLLCYMGERLNGIQEVRGSTPLISTRNKTSLVSSDQRGFFSLNLNERIKNDH